MLISRLQKLGDIISQLGILDKLHVVPDADIERTEAELLATRPPSIGVVNSQKKPLSDGAAAFRGQAAPSPECGVSLPLGCLSTASLNKTRFYIYILECEPAGTGNIYVGQTERISDRLWQHITGEGSAFTKANKPFQLIHLEIRTSRTESLKREAELIKMVSSGTPIHTHLPSEFSKFFDEVTKIVNKYSPLKGSYHMRKHAATIPLVEEWGDIEW